MLTPQAQLLHKLTGYKPIKVNELAVCIREEIEVKKERRACDEVICPICQCEMFDNVDYLDSESVQKA